MQLMPSGAPIRVKAFICGCGHSGTTLLATILAVHPEVYVPLYETRIFKQWGPRARWKYWRLQRLARSHGKTALVEKTPRHINRMHVIRKIVPGAKFLLLVRDGRDNVASLNRRYRNVDRALRRWIRENKLVLAERGKPDVLIVRYEDLIADLRPTLETICAFLSLPFDVGMLEYHRSTRTWSAGKAVDHAALRNRQVNQPVHDTSGRWREELSPEIIAELTEGAGKELMESFGYR